MSLSRNDFFTCATSSSQDPEAKRNREIESVFRKFDRRARGYIISVDLQAALSDLKIDLFAVEVKALRLEMGLVKDEDRLDLHVLQSAVSLATKLAQRSPSRPDIKQELHVKDGELKSFVDEMQTLKRHLMR